MREEVMIENWQQWVGRVVADDIPLLEYLGGSSEAAVFSTTIFDRSAAVKLLYLDQARAEEQLTSFRVAEKLSHPHLLRVYRVGKVQIDGEDLLYIVMEFAEENLSQVLPQRALTPAEAREMLTGTIDALSYLHREGVVHADIKPANIMAAGDQLKLSVDGVHRAGDRLRRKPTVYDAPESSQSLSPGSDIYSLGVAISEVLTQRTGTGAGSAGQLSAPFAEIVSRCTQRDPRLRPSLAEVTDLLAGKAVPKSQVTQVAPAALKAPTPVAVAPAPAKSSSRRMLLVVAAIAVVIVIVMALPSRHPEPTPDQAKVAASSKTEPTNPTPPATEEARAPQGEPTNSAPVPTPVTRPPASKKPSAATTEAATSPASSSSSVVKQVLPEVPQSALNTISGTVRVQVKVQVDPQGNVVDSEFVRPGPSKYFSRLAMEAARDWKFAPSTQPTAWNLQFDFRQSGASAVSTAVNE
jgi:TonB family protein